MTEVEMVYTKKEIFVVAVTVLCSVMGNLSFADATADSIMFRRKPTASAVSREIVQETVVQPVAVETVEIPKTEEKPAEPAKVADVSVVKEAAEKPVPERQKTGSFRRFSGKICSHKRPGAFHRSPPLPETDGAGSGSRSCLPQYVSADHKRSCRRDKT